MARGRGFEQDSGTNTSLYREPYKTQTRSAHNLKIKEINVVLKKQRLVWLEGDALQDQQGAAVRGSRANQNSPTSASRETIRIIEPSPVSVRVVQSEASDGFSFSDVI